MYRGQQPKKNTTKGGSTKNNVKRFGNWAEKGIGLYPEFELALPNSEFLIPEDSHEDEKCDYPDEKDGNVSGERCHEGKSKAEDDAPPCHPLCNRCIPEKIGFCILDIRQASALLESSCH